MLVLALGITAATVVALYAIRSWLERARLDAEAAADELDLKRDLDEARLEHDRALAEERRADELEREERARAQLERELTETRELKRGWLEQLEVEPIVVELKEGRTVAGYLVAVHADAIVLEHARYLGADIDGPMGGQVGIPRDRIAWVQRGIKVDGLEARAAA